MSFISELKRRNVFRTGILYLVASWLILQVGDVLFEALALPDYTQRIVLAVLLLGFPVALIFAWAFELTPEGVKRERDVPQSESVTAHTARKLDLAVIVLLVMALALIAFERFESPTDVGGDEVQARAAAGEVGEGALAPRTGELASVAVLPFRNMSASAEQEFFAEGLSDTLIHVLAQIDDLKVAARTSSFAFKDKEVDIREVAEKLGVGAVLEGSVQSSGDRLRIIAQLIDASDGTHLWSATFDRTNAEIFDIQDEIATEVVVALKGVLLEADVAEIRQQYEPSLEAYTEFVRGREAMAWRTAESLARADEHFQRALEIDPDYPLALVNLGDTRFLRSIYGALDRREAQADRKRLLDRALALAPRLGEAHTSLADWHRFEGELEAAEQHYLKAIELNPNYATAYHWYGLYLNALNRREEAMQAFQQAAQLDPLAPVLQAVLIRQLDDLGKDEAARQALRNALRDNPGFAGFYSIAADVADQRGDIGRRAYWLRASLAHNPGGVSIHSQLCLAYRGMNDAEAFRRCAGEVIDGYPGTVFAAALGMTLALDEGRVDEAIEIGRRYAETADNSEMEWIGRILAGAYLRRGDYARTLAMVRRLRPEFAPPIEPGAVTASNWRDAAPVAWVLARAGQEDAARPLADQFLAHIADKSRSGAGGYGGLDGFAHAALGNHQQATYAWVAGYEEAGLRIPDADLADPWFQELIDQPDFQQLMARTRTDLAEQREWLRQAPDLAQAFAERRLDELL